MPAHERSVRSSRVGGVEYAREHTGVPSPARGMGGLRERAPWHSGTNSRSRSSIGSTARDHVEVAMSDLRERIRRSPRALFAALVVGTALVAVALAAAAYTGDPDPGAACRRSGIVPLELAGDEESAAHIVGDWTCPDRGQTVEQAESAAERALARDTFLFIPLYVLSIGYWCFYASWYAHTERARNSARLLTYGIVVAGMLDVIENVALYGVVHGHANRAVLATAVSIPKWVLVIVGVARGLQAFGGAWMRWLRYAMFGEADRPQFAG